MDTELGPVGKVLVVGGGVAGVQASLDLAYGGLKLTCSKLEMQSAERWLNSTRHFPRTTAPCASFLPN
jgi:heterodisulfide reductase subunit A-like polyferredoxin